MTSNLTLILYYSSGDLAYVMVHLEALLLLLISLIVPTQAFHKLSSSPNELFFPPLLISSRQDCALVLYSKQRMMTDLP